MAMMKNAKRLLVAVALVGMAAGAQAGVVTWKDTIIGPTCVSSGSCELGPFPVGGQNPLYLHHNITEAGQIPFAFDSSQFDILDVDLTIWLADDSDGRYDTDPVSFKFGAGSWTSSGAVDGWNGFAFDLDNNLLSTGKLTVGIRTTDNTTGEDPDFWFVASELVVSATPKTVRVPEPGTLALLGLGLVGIGLARRRQKVAA